MGDLAIQVRGLSKRYTLGATKAKGQTFRELIAGAGANAYRNVAKWLRREPRRSETLWALKDVSFEVRRGEVIGVIGRNGAGKSTLLKVLSRITEPTEGRIDLLGRVGSLLEVGTGFHPELSGRENIYLNGAILGMRRAEIDRKFDEIVAFAEVEKFIDTAVKHYSSGMYLRLAFAVAAHLEPEILVVDEVLAVGDMAFQKKCLGKMENVAQHGRTVLFVSHNMAAVTALCSRAIMLDQGRVVRDGKAEEVVAAYLEDGVGSSSSTWSDLQSSPGEAGFKLRSVSIVDRRGQGVSIVNVEEPIRLRIRYHIHAAPMVFRLVAMFHTQGTCAFATMQPFEIERTATGDYEAEVEVPANYLAEGEYIVSISAFASRGKKLRYCQVKDVVAFQVFDPVKGTSARGDYTENFSGLLRPKLHWEDNFVGRSPVATAPPVERVAT